MFAKVLSVAAAGVFAAWVGVGAGASAPAPALHHELFGMNAHYYRGQAGFTSLRYYVRGIPATFPGGKEPLPPGITPVVSAKVDPAAFAAGAYDMAVRRWLTQAPAGSLVTIDHEANGPRRDISRVEYLRAVRRLVWLAEPYPVAVGQIFATYPVQRLGQDLAAWMVPGLDFYGLDGYQDHAWQTPAGVFGRAYAQVRAVSPDSDVGIAETNSRVDAAAWAAVVYPWAASRPYLDFFTWFTCPAHVSFCPFGALPMPPAAVVAAEARLAAAP